MNEPGNERRSPFADLTAAERTDRGRVRDNNEDLALCLPEAGLFVLADGMGGAREGEVAARAAVDHLKDACSDPALPLPARIRRCREAANAASLWIRQYAARQGNPGMGTTVALLVFDPFDPAAAACLHAGDSRLYRFRNGVLEQITRDHSMATLAGMAHEGQVPSLFRGVITRAVGVRRSVELEVTSLDVARGDLYLLCTDGLYNQVPRDEVARILEQGYDLDAKAVSLVEAALHGGGEDNITVVLVRADGAPEGNPAAAAASASAIPPSARETREKRLSGPLISLLMLALVAFLAVWFAFIPWRNRPSAEPAEYTVTPVESAAPGESASPAEPAPEAAPDPAAPPEPAVAPAPPVVPVLENPESAPEAAWGREREEVAADPSRVRARHQVVNSAFLRLGEWTGKPLAAPSLMFAGKPGDEPEAWARYLAGAQTQWCDVARAECGRFRAELDCAPPARVKALWRMVRGTGEDDPEYKDLEAALADWRRELDQMDKFLREEGDPARPFLYAFRVDLFTPGRDAAGLGDRVWDRLLPLINTLWQRRAALLEGRDEAGAAQVDETIRQANAIWEGYVGAGHRLRVWRQGMNTEAMRGFFERLPDNT